MVIEGLTERLSNRSPQCISAIALWDCAIVITRRLRRLKMCIHSVFTLGNLLVKDYGGTDRKDYPD